MKLIVSNATIEFTDDEIEHVIEWCDDDSYTKEDYRWKSILKKCQKWVKPQILYRGISVANENDKVAEFLAGSNWKRSFVSWTPEPKSAIHAATEWRFGNKGCSFIVKRKMSGLHLLSCKPLINRLKDDGEYDYFGEMLEKEQEVIVPYTPLSTEDIVMVIFYETLNDANTALFEKMGIQVQPFSISIKEKGGWKTISYKNGAVDYFKFAPTLKRI